MAQHPLSAVRGFASGITTWIFGERISEDEFFRRLVEASQQRGTVWRITKDKEIRTEINGFLQDPVIFLGYHCHEENKVPAGWLQASRAIGMSVGMAHNIDYASDGTRNAPTYHRLHARLLEALELHNAAA